MNKLTFNNLRSIGAAREILRTRFQNGINVFDIYDLRSDDNP